MGIARAAVYGTLRQGFHNHRVLGKNAVLEGTTRIPGFIMYSIGQAYPGVVRGDGEITVELYKNVDIPSMDVLESEGSLYLRQTEVINGKEYSIYVFNYPVVKYKRVESGDWLEEVTSVRKAQSSAMFRFTSDFGAV